MESLQDKVRSEEARKWARRTVKEGRDPRAKEHHKIVADSLNIFNFTLNPENNRFQNIVLYDATRVKLEPTAKGDISYIHASW